MRSREERRALFFGGRVLGWQVGSGFVWESIAIDSGGRRRRVISTDKNTAIFFVDRKEKERFITPSGHHGSYDGKMMDPGSACSTPASSTPTVESFTACALFLLNHKPCCCNFYQTGTTVDTQFCCLHLRRALLRQTPTAKGSPKKVVDIPDDEVPVVSADVIVTGPGSPAIALSAV